jgi:pimeloyl-ACP methyl ester carboxylesterase
VTAGEGSVRLADGRTLAYREYGAGGGRPLFYFHGWPGSRLDFAPNDAAAVAAGARVIAVDRPGIGGSDPLPGRSVLDWPADVAALADALAIERFAVLGFSFGGPFARACAYALPERVSLAVLVSAVGPLKDPAAGARLLPRPLRAGLVVARRWPALALPFVWLNAREPRAGRRSRDGDATGAGPAVSGEAAASAAMAASTVECFRPGLQGALADLAAVARGEGFRLEDITIDVQIWQGELDQGVPPAIGRSQERRIPRASAHYVADGGHMILISHAEEILAGVAGVI